MKEKKDIGLSYLRQLEIDPPKESKLLYFRFSAKYGETRGRSMLTDLYRKIRESEENPNYLTEFYEMKNESLDKALLFNGGYQGDNYRQICNWIVDNHDVFGKEILDAGCECGVISCFLGMAFPESHITAVDRSPNAIKAAKELAERLDVHNITFINADIKKLHGQKFDTVFAMRLLQENCDINHIMSSYNMLKAEAENFAENIHDFAETLAALVAEDGYLVSAERCDVDPVFLGWMQKLNELGLAVVTECYREMVCEEMENQGRIQVITAKKTGPEEMDEVYRFWCTCQVSHTDLVQDSQYRGWYADMELQNFGKELLGGFILHDTSGNALLTYSLWTHRELPDLLLLYQAMSDEHILSVFGNSSKDDILRQLEDMKKEYVAQGTIAKSLAFENGVLLCR